MSNEYELTQRRIKLVSLVANGTLSWDEIAHQAGYNSRQAAHKDYHAILRRHQEELAASLDDHRRAMLERLFESRRVAAEVMRREHLAISGGGVVIGTDDQPLLDDGPRLAAIDRLNRIDAQIAQLLGLNAPTRVEAEGQVKVVIEGIDVT